VHDQLFPYAREALPAFVREHAEEAEIAALLQQVRIEAGMQEASLDAITGQLLQWIDEDKKVTPLKALQGLIWKSGYERGDFTGHVYADTPEYLRAWKSQGIALYVYSSGSVQAQKLLFAHSDAGDLCPLFSGYFDTRAGHKREEASYRAIAKSIGVPAQEILFLSDVVEELDAAAAAGMQTTQLVRDADTQAGKSHRVAHTFADVILDPQIPSEEES
jgi:enolase-phosphatase E1